MRLLHLRFYPERMGWLTSWRSRQLTLACSAMHVYEFWVRKGTEEVRRAEKREREKAQCLYIFTLGCSLSRPAEASNIREHGKKDTVDNFLVS